jgi:putative Mg2+ transporter-C (MgtC) family protein
MLAGAAIGFNRGSQGHAAGFRTNIMVGLASCVAMVLANLLLATYGRTESSFADMDVMRLPLGILTGMGFIGGGCILKKDELVTGVTTAATLWSITVIGLCFGGGQLFLGVVASLLSIFILWTLKWFDIRIPRIHRARVLIEASGTEPITDLKKVIRPFDCYSHFILQRNEDKLRILEFEIQWVKSDKEFAPSVLLKELEKHYSVKLFELTAEKIDYWL